MIKILHIDDSHEDLELTRRHLTRLTGDIVIESADNPKEALETLRTSRYELILCDFQMPDMDGLQILRTLRNRGDSTSFIFLTGQGNERIAAEALRSGADDYFVKEAGFVHYERLINSIRRIVNANKQTEKRRHVEMALRESEEKYQHLVARAKDVITIVQDAVIKYVSPSIENLLGYSMEEVQGTKFSHFVAPEELPRLNDIYKRRMSGEDLPQIYETTLLNKDGRPIDVEINTGIITLRGRPAELAFVSGISERKRAQEELRGYRRLLETRSQELQVLKKNLESFTNSISRDLRGPLDDIDGFNKALLQEYAGRLNKKGNEYLQEIGNSCQRMQGLINDLLKLFQLSSAEIHPEETDLSAMSREIASQLSRSVPDRLVELRIEEGLHAVCDQSLLWLVLENLLHNSWKFTQNTDKARIEVGAKEREGKRTFYVKDNGVGFDNDKADNLFSPFARLHPEKEFEGNGVGLAVVQMIVQRHGGNVWAEGRVGKGATIYFTLN